MWINDSQVASTGSGVCSGDIIVKHSLKVLTFFEMGLLFSVEKLEF